MCILSFAFCVFDLIFLFYVVDFNRKSNRYFEIKVFEIFHKQVSNIICSICDLFFTLRLRIFRFPPLIE